MSAQDERFEYDSYQDNESIQKYLQALQDGFENKRLVFTSENREIVLEPEDIVRFAVKAFQKKDKGKIEIKISWQSQESKLDNTMTIDS